MIADVLRHRRRAARDRALAEQLPEIARALARATAAGLPFPDACARSADALPDPARSALGEAAALASAGAGPPEALAGLIPVGGGVLVAAVAIHGEVGGDLVRSLRAIGDGLAASRRVRGDVAVALAQARFASHVVPVIPLAALALAAAASPESVAPLVTTTTGRALLMASLVLDLAALGILRRIARGVGA